MSKIPTAHNQAKAGDFAKIVLMPGDPLRAQFIAENFLTNVRQVNSVRGMLAFTGEYEGIQVSVMGHGMGNPSIGIYSYELFAFYGVETIIRIGSCGAFVETLGLGDIIIGATATSYSTFAAAMGIDLKDNIIHATPSLVTLAQQTAASLNQPIQTGMVLSSDTFYGTTQGPVIDQMIKDKKILATEMEAFALYTNAQKLHKEALTILTVSDLLYRPEEMTSEERQKGFTRMMKLALEITKKKVGK